MKISVNEQTQTFYLACDTWKSVVGHEIRIGKFRFCAIPVPGYINVSEVTTGSKILDVPMTLEMMLDTETKEGAMLLFQKIGESIKSIINRQDNFELTLEKMKALSFELLGEMPPIIDYDSTWLFDEESEVLN